MHITPGQTPLKSKPRNIAAKSPATAPGLKPGSTEAFVPSAPLDFVSNLPSNFQDIDVAPLRFPDSPPPALPRPVIFLHGYNGSSERWEHVFDWLTSGDEPGNKRGGIVEPDKLDNLDGDANLFSLKLSRPFNSVEKNVSELKQTVEAVLKATGAEEVDLVVHSLGGLGARAYLEDSDEKVSKLIMLGTPNHGSQLANMELFSREKFGFPVAPRTDDPEVRRVLKQLSVDKNNRKGQPKNPWLRALNNNWDQQKDNAEIMIVSGAGVPTLTGGPGITVFGDGVVTRKSSKLSGVTKKTTWFRTHGAIQNSPKVMENAANFLAGRELAADENLFDSPEDAIRAAELTTQKSSEPVELTPATPQQVATAVQLPLLDPAFQFGLGLGVLSAIMGGPKEALPLLELSVHTSKENNKIDANYDIDLLRENNQIQGSGFVNDQGFVEVAELNEGKVNWKSALGLLSSGMSLEVRDDERSISMKGLLGGVAADLTLAMTQDEDGRVTGMKTDGLLNGQPYHLRSTVDLASFLEGQPLHHTSLESVGIVNGEVVETNYLVDVRNDEEGLSFKATVDEPRSDGLAGGVEVKIRDRAVLAPSR